MSALTTQEPMSSNFSDFSQKNGVLQTHAEVVFNYFSRAYNEDKYTDIVVRCDANVVRHAQRLVLAAFSSNFSVILRGVKNIVVNLDIESSVTGVSAEDLTTVLDYMYSGNVQLSCPSMINSLRALGCHCIVPLLAHFEQNGAGRRLIIEDADHANCFLMALERFYTEERFCDCTLRFQDKSFIKCHRLVLSAFSEFFEDIFKERWSSCEHVIINVNLLCSEISSHDMRTIVEFMYTGKVNAARRRFPTLCEAAKRVSARRLVDVLSDALASDSRPFPHYSNDSADYNAPLVPHRDNADVNDDDSTVIVDGVCETGFEETTTEDCFGATTENDADLGGIDYSEVYDTYIKGPARGKKLFCKKRSFKSNDDLNENVMLHETSPGTSDMEPQFYIGNHKEFVEKPFKCPYCDHRTKEKSAVEKHIRCIHTQETPYQCNVCQQSFKVQSNLMRHLRIHTGEKPYVCKKCGMSYADKKNMDAHVYREHLRQTPYACPTDGCSAKFWRRDRLENHCKKFQHKKVG